MKGRTYEGVTNDVQGVHEKIDPCLNISLELIVGVSRGNTIRGNRTERF